MNIQIKDKLRSFILSEKFSLAHGIIQYFTMLAWLVLLSYTNSYYVIYLMIGMTGLFCRIIDNQDKNAIFQKEERKNAVIAAIFSLAVILANYDILANYINEHIFVSESHLSMAFYLVYVPLALIGGMYVTFFILRSITQRLSKLQWNKHTYTRTPSNVFFSVFFIISIFYASVMLLCFFPGITSTDSMAQINQILSGHYSNHHPYYHTLIIRFFIFLGMSVFKSMNIGVALYSLFSIALLATAFAYAVVTIYQLQIHKTIVIASALFFMFTPINIVYSFTMWKDVPFAACMLIFTVSLFRYLEKTGNSQTVNLVISLLSGLGVSLLRSNGMFAFAIAFVCFALWFGKKERRMCVAILCVLCVSFVMKHPVLNAIGVEKTEMVESLSIPLQQVSRTVVENDDLTSKQKTLISKAMSIDTIKELYNPGKSDPIKFYLVDYGGQEYIQKHMSEYALLYIRLGITHPASYFKAWIDQTKGYWNGGYTFWRYTFLSTTDYVGTKRIVVSERYQKLIYAYLQIFDSIDFFKPILSIGLYTWLVLLVAFIGYRKKNKVTVLLTVPCIANILSLLIATPVFAEFRYAYSLFCCLPFLTVIAFRGSSEQLNNEEIKTDE